jgi:methanogenic corrinoid protein MtbC1
MVATGRQTETNATAAPHGIASGSQQRMEQECIADRLTRIGASADRLGLSIFSANLDADDARSLTSLIESEIIPRMLIAHSGPVAPLPPPTGDAAITAADLDAFVPLAMTIEADELLALIDILLARGVAVETLLVDLLAPTARRLGEYWESDHCDFTEVTMGLWRLQEVVHDLASRRPAIAIRPESGRRALFAAVPGDQHTFGAMMIEEIFRRESWDTDRLCDVNATELLDHAAQHWFDVIGLTISCDCHIGALGAIIADLRTVSRNRQVCIMIGGRIVNAQPALVSQVGADGMAGDAKSAPRIASQLVRQRGRALASS